MVDSTQVLWGQTLMYTAYALAILVVVAWFGLAVTRDGKRGSRVSHRLFFGFFGLLVLIGVSLHVITYNTIPWVSRDLHNGSIEPDQSIAITVADHEFMLPEGGVTIQCGETVLFDVTSTDLTYGFGLFRTDNSMVFQMQVVPGHPNSILWEFDRDASYTIRSTEYSGPAGIDMVVPDAVSVVGCG